LTREAVTTGPDYPPHVPMAEDYDPHRPNLFARLGGWLRRLLWPMAGDPCYLCGRPAERPDSANPVCDACLPDWIARRV
jgi:hypothetical protein